MWRRVAFPGVDTDCIRVLVNASLQGYSRLAEVEAWTVAASYPIAGTVTSGGAPLELATGTPASGPLPNAYQLATPP